MKIILYNNYSENNKLDKSIVKIIELVGYLREASSLINPSILIELNPNTIDTLVMDDSREYVVYNNVKIQWDTFIYNYVLTANYVYIPDFNRYYFINDIISVRNNLWRINMHVDVLMSYQKQIKNLNAFVNRNEFEFDVKVKDDLVSYYYDKEVTETIPDKGDLVNTTFETDVNHTRNIVLCCISDNDIPSHGDIIPPEFTNLPTIKQEQFVDSHSMMCYIMDIYDIGVVMNAILNNDQLLGYIKNVILYPFDLEYIGNENTKWGVVIGSDTIYERPNEELRAYALKDKISKYYVIEDFVLEGNGDFFDYDPYTKYELYIPYFGWCTLSPDQCLNHRIIVYYTMQFDDGSSNVYVYDVTDNKLLFTSSCQLGIKLGLSSTNNYEITKSKEANSLNLTIGLLSSMASIGIGALTYNPIAVVGGVLGGAKSIANYVNNNSMLFDKAVANYGSSASGMYSSQRTILRKTKLKPKNYDENYAKLYGKPLNKYMKIEDLNGFTILGEVHLENFGSATKQEKELLKNILETGIIL